MCLSDTHTHRHTHSPLHYPPVAIPGLCLKPTGKKKKKTLKSFGFMGFGTGPFLSEECRGYSSLISSSPHTIAAMEKGSRWGQHNMGTICSSHRANPRGHKVQRSPLKESYLTVAQSAQCSLWFNTTHTGLCSPLTGVFYLITVGVKEGTL